MTPHMTPPRELMLQDIADAAAECAPFTGSDHIDLRVMAAMERVPRAEFVPIRELSHAYANGPLPIGHGQTISQPFIVALMTDLLRTAPHHVILEVGCGSGYQSAVLSHLVRQVHSVEIVPELAREAAARLARLGYANVEVRAGDGYHGWAELAPFDGIIVTAAAREIPPALTEQLRPGGRLVIPIGAPFDRQHLFVVEKSPTGELRERNVLPVAFVPLTRRFDAGPPDER